MNWVVKQLVECVCLSHEKPSINTFKNPSKTLQCIPSKNPDFIVFYCQQVDEQNKTWIRAVGCSRLIKDNQSFASSQREVSVNIVNRWRTEPIIQLEVVTGTKQSGKNQLTVQLTRSNHSVRVGTTPGNWGTYVGCYVSF